MENNQKSCVNHVRNYMLVTASYWSFMLTDGALRMLVLLCFHEHGYSPVSIATLFLCYEFFGILTNFFGGWIANSLSLKFVLTTGMFLQIVALTMLSFLNKQWPSSIAIPFVLLSQSLSGVAKDLTKLSSKTSVKFLVSRHDDALLFKWVAILTGSKNSVKGFGFFSGALCLQFWGFQRSLWVMAAFILIFYLLCSCFLSKHIGTNKSKKTKLSEIFRQGRKINFLSTARIFLFGARDIWFVVGVPLFLNSTLGWSFSVVGAFMAVWVIAYGGVQVIAPWVVKLKMGGRAPTAMTAYSASRALTIFTAIMTWGYVANWSPVKFIVGGLFVYGIIFALNSAIHSFLILDYAAHDKAAINVGFYYMANALGRFLGTFLSGFLYQIGGLSWCLQGSLVFLFFSTIIIFRLKKELEKNEK
jgi:predicted MFS family arabinose efflux permease